MHGDGRAALKALKLLGKEERMLPMNKERFLTVRWNNILSLALGLPALFYIYYAYSTSLWNTRGGLIGLALIGVLY